MKKIVSLIMALLLLLSLTSCDKYVSSYKALGLVRNQTSDSCDARFYSLEGQLVFKLKAPASGQEGELRYSVEVDEGEIHLYYDAYDVKQELAHVQAGESVMSRGGYIESGRTVYVIIEATGKAKGKVTVELDT